MRHRVWLAAPLLHLSCGVWIQTALDRPSFAPLSPLSDEFVCLQCHIYGAPELCVVCAAACAHAQGVRLGELIARWGGDDNIVDRSEFEAQVGELGLKASVEEIGRLFDALDKDGGGTLDGHELKHALKDLVDEADATTKRVRQMERAVLERAKSAKDSQDAWKAKEVALLRTEAAEAERQRLAAEAREAAAAKEKAAQRAALEEKRQAAALEKAAFEARVEERSIRKHQRKTEKGAAAAAPTK